MSTWQRCQRAVSKFTQVSGDTDRWSAYN